MKKHLIKQHISLLADQILEDISKDITSNFAKSLGEKFRRKINGNSNYKNQVLNFFKHSTNFMNGGMLRKGIKYNPLIGKVVGISNSSFASYSSQVEHILRAREVYGKGPHRLARYLIKKLNLDSDLQRQKLGEKLKKNSKNIEEKYNEFIIILNSFHENILKFAESKTSSLRVNFEISKKILKKKF